MQSILFKPSVSSPVLKSIEVILVSFLFFLAYYLFQNNETIMVKIGMSRLFSPTLVGIIAYGLPVLALGCGLCLLLSLQRRAVIPALLLLGAFTVYSLYLFIKTGSECGCSNLFFEMDLRKQILIGAGVIGLCLVVWFQRKTPGAA